MTFRRVIYDSDKTHGAGEAGLFKGTLGRAGNSEYKWNAHWVHDKRFLALRIDVIALIWTVKIPPRGFWNSWVWTSDPVGLTHQGFRNFGWVTRNDLISSPGSRSKNRCVGVCKKNTIFNFQITHNTRLLLEILLLEENVTLKWKLDLMNYSRRGRGYQNATKKKMKPFSCLPKPSHRLCCSL